jgi:hypothetical protein
LGIRAILFLQRNIPKRECSIPHEASYMQVAERLLNISANVCARRSPVVIAGWPSIQYGGIVVIGGQGMNTVDLKFLPASGKFVYWQFRSKRK